MGCGSSNDTKAYTKVDQSIWRGRLTVHLRKATIKKDFQLLGKMDPYIKLNLGKQQKISNVCEDGGQFPTWKNEHFDFKRTCEEDIIYVQMWNKNAITSDDFMGEGGFALTKVRKGTNGKIDATCVIFGKTEEIGTVELALEFQLDEDCKNHPEVLAPDTTGQAIVRPIKALLQRDTVFLFGTMSPVSVIKLGDETQASGANIDGGKNPKWSDQLVFTRDSIANDTFTIECQNFNESSDNELIGVGFLSMTSCLVKDAKVNKTVDLYFEGTPVGNLTLEIEYVSDDPEAYDEAQANQNQQPAQQQGQQQQPVQQYQRQQTVFPSNGAAEFRYPNGDFYNGDWQNGQKSGNGQMTFRSGMVYNGQWLNDHFHGQGTLTVSGTTYIGNFLNGRKSGQGTITWQGNQQKYEGEWLDNKYHGIGNWTHANGQTQQGEFQYGNRTRWIENKPQVFLPAGRCIMQGGSLPSDNGQFVLTLAYNGWIQVFNSQTRQVTFQINQFPQMPRAPFFLRLENDGRLQAIDGSSQTYYCSRLAGTPIQGQGPFKLIMQDDGRIAIHDQNAAIWYSH